MLQVRDEAQKQAQLDRMRFLATALLACAAVVFLVARFFEPRHAWVGFVRATAEAAMVGAIADWFAVTALFRHPLGIPIPHTAIVPHRKDQIGRSLGRFVENNFLSREVLAAKIRSLDVALRLGSWLQQPENARRMARHAASGLGAAVRVLRDEEIQGMIERGLVSRLEHTEVTPLLGSTLSVVTSADRKQRLLDGTLTLVGNLLEDNRDVLREKVDQELPWWVPAPIDEKIYQKIMRSIERAIGEISADPEHPIRERFDALVTRFVEDLKSSPEMIARGEAIKEEFLRHDGVRTFAQQLWTELKASLLAHGADPDSGLRTAFEEGITRFGHTLLDDEVLLARIDQWAEKAIVYIAEEYRHEVGALIAHTVEQWDPEETSRKIELQVGKDLQFIRINGTVVGGLAGLVIYTLSLLF